MSFSPTLLEVITNTEAEIVAVADQVLLPRPGVLGIGKISLHQRKALRLQADGESCSVLQKRSGTDWANTVYIMGPDYSWPQVDATKDVVVNQYTTYPVAP
jgi:hypothetical protein